jgi:DNA-binding transcriptional MerR regulator
MYRVGEVAAVAKVTVRTLHHYDEIGLLIPSGRSGSGYRLYTEDDIARLQHIRFHRELGLALEEIRAALASPDFDAGAVLRAHRERLVSRLRETEALVATIDRTLRTLDGETEMSAEERFDGFQPEEHAAEAKARWGDTSAYKESARRTSNYGPADWEVIQAEADGIVVRFAGCRDEGAAADSDAAMALAEEHRQHIDRWFYACSPQMHVGLSEMYVQDERFAAYFDKHGEGLSAYVAEAIRANAAAAA